MNYDNELSFWVYGVPAPGGSKRSWVPFKDGKPMMRSGGSVIVNTIESSGQKNKDWRAAVSQAAGEAMQGRGLLQGALSVRIVFNLPRPKGHYKKDGSLSSSAPRWHIKKPDVLKLARSTEDAMTGIVWRDDSLIVVEDLRKNYALGPAGASITIQELG